MLLFSVYFNQKKVFNISSLRGLFQILCQAVHKPISLGSIIGALLFSFCCVMFTCFFMIFVLVSGLLLFHILWVYFSRERPSPVSWFGVLNGSTSSVFRWAGLAIEVFNCTEPLPKLWGRGAMILSGLQRLDRPPSWALHSRELLGATGLASCLGKPAVYALSLGGTTSWAL